MRAAKAAASGGQEEPRRVNEETLAEAWTEAVPAGSGTAQEHSTEWRMVAVPELPAASRRQAGMESDAHLALRKEE